MRAGGKMAAGFKTVEPLEYYRRFLKENCRPDGRELGEFRTTTVNVGSISTADGSALVKLGNTTVICGIKAEFAAPPTDAPDKGYIEKLENKVIEMLQRIPPLKACPWSQCLRSGLGNTPQGSSAPSYGICLSVPNVDLPPLCSSRFRSGPPGEEAQVASQFIADVIENSQIIQKEDLCISQGKLAWVLYCDLICLDYDGNILDASTFALLAALKNVQLPEVNINEETALAEVNLKKKSHLNIRNYPVATSFAIFDDTLLIVDPTGEEEHLATGTLTVVTDEGGRLCCLHKPGGSGLTGAKLQDCMSRAVTRHKEVKKLMDEVIQSMKPK
ncbi:exosome complex component RRP43 isoform X2 [Elephas maximus indicus]|uniref:exosome complex component RRP43 isoform X2 n=1 Tax=Elephas maximus indicus TaxID=99487 RepID=UPI0021166916|nr:exosome complex component RRP43 isoform X2 [Elephas maximus indicus]